MHQCLFLFDSGVWNACTILFMYLFILFLIDKKIAVKWKLFFLFCILIFGRSRVAIGREKIPEIFQRKLSLGILEIFQVNNLSWELGVGLAGINRN